MKKMGRPKAEDDKRRDVRIQVRMNEEEAASLDELCAKFNCGRSSFIRSLVSKVRNDISGGDHEWA